MRRLFALLAAMVLTACVGMKAPPAPVDGFSATGRVSIRSGSDSHYANFTWQSAPQSDQLSFGNPLGQTLAELQIHYQGGQADYAVLTDAGGTSKVGAPEQLLRDATGMQLPVEGMRWWLQGLPAPGVAANSRTEEGRLIEQAGWRIVANEFTETTPKERGPRKITLTRGELTVRIVISEWQWQISPQS